MLYLTPELDAADHRVLAEIDQLYADFVKATGGSAAREWVGGLRKRLVAGAIMGSNSIEGYSVDITTASAVLTNSPLSTDIPEDSREAVIGYRDALTWSMHTPDMDFFTHSETILSALHFTMMRFWRDKSPGLYRRGGVIVTGADAFAPTYVGPDARDVPGLMAELVAWLMDGDLGAHMLVRAAMAHLNLVAIHPWRDGNGRMSRCLQTLVIARAGRLASEFCSIEEWLGHDINTLDYYRALRQATQGSHQPTRSARDWMKFCLRAHHLQAQIVDRRLQYASQVWAAMAEIVERMGFTNRMVAALDAATNGALRRDVYQADETLSRDQSIRDIRQLQRAGLVEAVGYGATLYYVAAGQARQIAEDIAVSLTRPTSEPYPEG